MGRIATMSDNKVELIKKVMEEVKDPALRDSILHEITKDKNSGNDSSAIDKAMKEFVITNVNKEAVGEFVVFTSKQNIIGGAVGGLIAIAICFFFLIGFADAAAKGKVFLENGGFNLMNGIDGIFGLVFILIGIGALINVARMSKIIKWGE